MKPLNQTKLYLRPKVGNWLVSELSVMTVNEEENIGGSRPETELGVPGGQIEDPDEK